MTDVEKLKRELRSAKRVALALMFDQGRARGLLTAFLGELPPSVQKQVEDYLEGANAFANRALAMFDEEVIGDRDPLVEGLRQEVATLRGEVESLQLQVLSKQNAMKMAVRQRDDDAERFGAAVRALRRSVNRWIEGKTVEGDHVPFPHAECFDKDGRP